MSGFTQVRVARPNGGERNPMGRQVGRLLIHESLNFPGKWAVTHPGTGGMMASAKDAADAERIALRASAEQSAGLDLLDLLDWGQQLPKNMRDHPAIKSLKAFREEVERA